MNAFKGVIVAGLVVLAACGGEKKESEAYDLSFKPKTGETKKVTYELHLDVPSKETKANFIMNLEVKVQETEQGKNKLAVEYKGICLEGEMKGIKINTCAGNKDSLTKDWAVLSAPIFSYLHSRFLMNMDERMRNTGEEIVSVDSTQTMLESQKSKAQFFTVLPDKTVAVGESWKHDIEIKAGNENSANATFTLKGVKAGKANIDMSGKIDSKGERFGYEYEMKGNLSGKAEVDIATGWTLYSEMTQDFTLHMGGNETPMKYTVIIRVE